MLKCTRSFLISEKILPIVLPTRPRHHYRKYRHVSPTIHPEIVPRNRCPPRTWRQRHIYIYHTIPHCFFYLFFLPRNCRDFSSNGRYFWIFFYDTRVLGRGATCKSRLSVNRRTILCHRFAPYKTTRRKLSAPIRNRWIIHSRRRFPRELFIPLDGDWWRFAVYVRLAPLY